MKAAGINPLDHYNQSGWHEGRDPSSFAKAVGLKQRSLPPMEVDREPPPRISELIARGTAAGLQNIFSASANCDFGTYASRFREEHFSSSAAELLDSAARLAESRSI